MQNVTPPLTFPEKKTGDMIPESLAAAHRAQTIKSIHNNKLKYKSIHKLCCLDVHHVLLFYNFTTTVSPNVPSITLISHQLVNEPQRSTCPGLLLSAELMNSSRLLDER